MRLPSLSAAFLGTNPEEYESLLAVSITSCTAPGKVAAEIGKEISWEQVWELALILTPSASELLCRDGQKFQGTYFNAHNMFLFQNF